MNKKIQNKSFINDLIFTYVSQFLLTVFHVVIIKLFANSLTESDFGAYMVIKRFVALSFPIVTLKLGMSLSKFIGSNIKKRTVYYFLSFLILSGLMILILIFSLVFKEPIAMLLFNNVRYKVFIVPMLLFLFISSLQVLTTGYFRGKHDFFLMNLNVILFWTIQLVVVIIVSIVKIDSFYKLFYFYIYSSIGAFILYTYLILQDTENIFRKMKNFINEGIISKIKNNYEYIKYGIIRLPNGFFVAGISAIPVFYASNRISLKSAGYVGAIVTIMRMFQLIG
ncbi:MAG: oligosaccharide flippase family protein, partial [Candidatus Marinimicrobia bacterium]|nr:oligosaccharide flippase family protein [Candidatus Neomarinimicrobiota bacterium]